MIFVDTGAWFAQFVPGDPDHVSANSWVAGNRSALVTTDYVVDELLSLLKVRGEYARASALGGPMLTGKLCRLEWASQTDIAAAWDVFSTFKDKDWSFTDCVSRVVMKRLDVRTAVAFDHHFRQFGTVAIVP